jgi:SAM-dependent methyltransferase
MPIDRFYIGRFIEHHAADIRGSVLEISRSTYVDLFGQPTKVTIADVDPTNLHANLVVDLCERESLPLGEFDCIILTQTLQYLADLIAALESLSSALAPGGVLLITVPALSRDDPRGADYWRFTPAGLERLLHSTIPADASLEVTAYGNVLAAVAMLHGLAVEETGRDLLEQDDTAYPVVVCARVVRSPV